MDDERNGFYLKNVDIDLKKKIIRINLNTMLYPRTVIMRAAYSFTESFDVGVDGDNSSTVVLIKVRTGDVKSHDDFEDIVYRFYSELIHASVEETQARRYADTRNALIGAALRTIIPVNMVNPTKDASISDKKEDK